MRAFAAVFAREVFARRLVFPVALAAGFMPLAGSLAYGWSKPDAAEGRILVALVTAVAFSFAFALLFGGSVLAGETSEKRMSFYFSRPLSPVAIWGGKLLAVFFLVLVSALLILAPALLTSSTRALGNMLGAGGHPGFNALALPGALLLLVLGAHAAVTVARLHSPWVALDLILGPALVFLAAAFFRTLVRNGLAAWPLGGFDLSPILSLLAVAVLVALAAASFSQVAAGRTDARRAHGAFSAVLWGILGAAIGSLGGYAWWVASAKATNLTSVDFGVREAPRGSWATLDGPLGTARGYGRFLFDTAGGRSIRVRGHDAAFSADGARAAWGEETFGFFERGRKSEVRVADLASAGPVDTGIDCSPWSRVALSPSGRRLAVVDGTTLAAYDATRPDNPQEIAAFRLSGEARHAVFVDEEVIRLFGQFHNPLRKDLAPAALEITELSLPSKKSLVTGRFERETLPFLRLSADGRYLVGTRRLTDDTLGMQVLTLHDGRTGALLATLSTDLRSPQLRFLTGGRIAVAGIDGTRAEMRIFLEGEDRRSATAARTIDLGPARRLVLGGEIAPGRVAVALFPFEENLAASQLAAKLSIVDAASGSVVSHADGLVPADRFGWWYSSMLPPAEAGTPASAVFLDPSGRLVRLDPATGAKTVLLGKGK